MEKLKYNVLFLEQQKMWTAQCLEFDIAAQAKSMEAAMEAFNLAFAAEILLASELGLELRDIAEPAPTYYHDRYKDQAAQSVKMKPQKFTLPPGVAAVSVLEGYPNAKSIAA